jgi:DNA-binding transcriptional MerR regulator
MGSWSFKDWYRQHGDALNSGRRFRYHLDPNYRERVLEHNRQSRTRKREETLEERRTKRVVKSAKPTPAYKTVKLDTGEEASSVGALAQALDRSIQTVRGWEKKGWIPETPHRTARGERLYTKKQIADICKDLEKAGRLGEARSRPVMRTAYQVRENGQFTEMELYPISVLAQACDRSIVTLDVMESKGALPSTPLRYGTLGRRLFSGPMIEVVREAFIRQGGEVRGQDAQTVFREEVETGWQGLGVYDVEVVDPQ